MTRYDFTTNKKYNFNSHTREGVTKACELVFLLNYFNSHTREGVTTEISMEFKEENFNSHTREGVTYINNAYC